MDIKEPEGAQDIVDQALELLPELRISGASLPAAAETLRDIFAASGRFFERGEKPVRIINAEGAPIAKALTEHVIINEAHRICTPMKRTPQGDQAITLPGDVAKLYLALAGEWNLPPLAGITGAPILAANGGIRSADGYDAETHLFCSRVPAVDVPDRPSREQAEEALATLRIAFETFPFADAETIEDAELGVMVVDPKSKPGRDESAFLVALLTAVCRPSLSLAPALMVSAPAISGAGTGKGLLIRAISIIAYGTQPGALTAGHDAAELDKRIVAKLMSAPAVLYLDNINDKALNSETLESVLTERPANVRVLGRSEIVKLDCAAFVAVTGNALTPSGDSVRRFLFCTLDARREDPESRKFQPGFLDEIAELRIELLSAVLTIWRWGRQNAAAIKKGKALGSFEAWAPWCRDPLMALGCADPVERLAELKAADPARQAAVAFFAAWYEKYSSDWRKLRSVDENVFATAGLDLPNIQKRRRYIESLSKTRSGGWMIDRRASAGRWGAAEYRVRRSDEEKSAAAD